MSNPKNDLYIGNTDHDWFNFCKNHPELTEVNFWQPSAKKFRVVDEGAIFFFRRKAPINLIGGFGTLVCSENASIGRLWADLEISNGIESEQDFIDRVKRYRKSEYVDQHTLVGFKILIDPVFLDEKDWFELPKDWSENIVTGKAYSSDSNGGQYLLKKYRELQKETTQSEDKYKEIFGFEESPQAGYKTGKAKIRIGQNLFRLSLLSAYQGRCAVTGTDVPEVLDAAHIQKFSENPNHAINNGLLLRKDIHTLFDCGYLEITEDYKVQLTEKFKLSHEKSSSYIQYEGKKITLPKNKKHWPTI